MEVHYTDNTTELIPKPPLWRRLFTFSLRVGVMLFILGLIGYAYILYLASPPENFPVGERITIEEGSSVKEISEQFKEAGYVRSDTLLYGIIILLYDPTIVKASLYRFNEPIDAFEMAFRLTEGDYGVDLKRFVHYEGERVTQIAKRAAQILEDFDKDKFIELALPKEGYLFPDTYLIPETYTAEELVELLNGAYEERIAPLRPAIARSRFTEAEVVTFASILEREANSRETKRIVSGILHNRLDIDMPLQVDAVFEYILHKPGTELTYDDLEVDDPYNTYQNIGLPPGPIGNPGLEAIEAVLEPDPSEYLYYLTGRDGRFYYAYTFEGHKANITNYLR